MAIVMDPMYKFELVDNCLEVIYANKMDKIREWISSLRKTLFDLYEYYKSIIGQNRSSTSTPTRGSSSSSSSLIGNALQIFNNRRRQTSFISSNQN